MDQGTIQTIIRDFHTRNIPHLTERETTLPMLKDMVVSIVGSRRCGKTYRTYQFVGQFVQSGGNVDNLCRVQFNDHRLSDIEKRSLSLIDNGYYALFPEKRDKEEVYFIFDEIHRIDGWEDYLLHLLETQTHRVIITGSTSRLLRGDISSALRGKNLPVVLYPFSFREFIRHYGVDDDTISSKGQDHLRQMAARYLAQGGFPGLLDLEEDLHLEVLQTYWDTMILRDIIQAHSDENIHVAIFIRFAQALASRIGCPMTVRRMICGFQEAGLSFTPEALYKYLKYLADAYMVFSVPIFSPSEKVQNRNYHKIYLVDWALADAVAPGGGVDDMRKFENIVFLELMRRGYDVSYYKTRAGHEIDFVAIPKRDRKKTLEIYQACYQMTTPEVEERELRGIPETARHLGVKTATIVTMNEERLLRREGIEISIVPLWKWLIKSA